MNTGKVFARRTAGWSLIAGLLLSGSCSLTQPVNDTARRHLLEPVKDDASAGGQEPAIGVARPKLPQYLEFAKLVSRDADGIVRNHQSDLWAEPLDVNMARTLAANLRAETGSGNIRPVDDFVGADYENLLEVFVNRFEPDGNGRVLLECDWRLQPLTGEEIGTRSFVVSVPMDDGGEGTSRAPQVAAMSEALGRLAETVAETAE